MTTQDTLADSLARVKNAVRAKMIYVDIPFSKVLNGILSVFKEEDVINRFERIQDKDGFDNLRVYLKYDNYNYSPIGDIQRCSKPGGRVYLSVESVRKLMFYNKNNLLILSTSSGIISACSALEKNVGGELMCKLVKGSYV